ncbi:cache domain-containing protein [Nonomuraea lactucae]|uniref:cache domain-containing protein n=1 Tax=Nonomuraea lactucae TaxID=2249762 RepID=UPI000DE389E0|nr:cache domain-containing protein [Nonomuraea lactucae]
MITKPDTATDAVVDIVEDVFAALREVRAVTERLRPRESGDLAALRMVLFERLGGLIAGIGFIAAPGLLRDAPWFLEWWQESPSGPVRLVRDLDPSSGAFYDYTHWGWYADPASGAERTVCGPYVDLLCTDEYALTLSIPVRVDGTFVGVAAADVFVRRFEVAVLPVLRGLGSPAFLVNADGRVVASTTTRHLTGTIYRGGGLPCGDLPLALVELRHGLPTMGS